MNIPNYHTHTIFCDGKARPEEMVKTAIQHHLPALGFTGHAPVPFRSDWNMSKTAYADYSKEIDRLQKKYSNRLKIYKGLEADYIAGITGPNDFKNEGLDYIIGAVHYLHISEFDENWDFIISPKVFQFGLENYYRQDIEALINDYFTAVNELITEHTPDIVAHIDQINKFNKGERFFSEKSKLFDRHTDETIELAKKHKVIIEINTRIAYRQLSDEFNPSDRFIQKMQAADIPIIFSADVHRENEMNKLMKEAVLKAKALGYKSHMVLTENGFVEQDIDRLLPPKGYL